MVKHIVCLILLSLATSYAFGATMDCTGRTNEGTTYKVRFDFEKMTVSVNEKTLRISSSTRTKSYMPGTQHIRFDSDPNEGAKLLYAKYYSTNTIYDNSITFMEDETGKYSVAWLSCSPELYNGPTNFIR